LSEATLQHAVVEIPPNLGKWSVRASRRAILVNERAPAIAIRDRAQPAGPSRHQPVAYALIALWIQFLLPHSIRDPDIWWHLRDAGQQLRNHAFLRADTYSFTATHAPWINHEWLAELPFLAGWHIAGTRGMLFVTGITVELIFMGVYWLAYRRSGSWPCATLITMIASLLATVSFGPRTLLFGWICLVVELILLELFEERPRVALGLPPLFLAWINLHGSWLIGIVLLATFFLSGCFGVERGLLHSPRMARAHLRLMGAAIALSVCALFINPYGWHLLAYPFDLAFHQTLNITHVEEWRPLDLQSSRGVIFLASLAALFFTQIITPTTNRRTWTTGELAFVAIGTYSAFRHTRFLFLAAIVVMPTIGGHLAHAVHSMRRGVANTTKSRALTAWSRAWLNAILLTAMILLSYCAMAYRSRSLRAPSKDFPEAALPFLKSFQPYGPLFNECLWGGYITYNVPHLQVFIDSRFDIFERNGTLKDYLDIIGLRKSVELLDLHHIRYVLFERDTPLVYLLQQTHQWQPLYDDGSTILLEHSVSALQIAADAQPR
jgi:hypothetical protein